MVFLLNLENQIIAYSWVSCYTRSISSSRRADMFTVSSESSFAFSFNIICCSIFQSCRLLCFAVLECNVKPSLIYSGIKCCLCIAKLQHPLKLTLVKDGWLEKININIKDDSYPFSKLRQKVQHCTPHFFSQGLNCMELLPRILMSCHNMLF